MPEEKDEQLKSTDSAALETDLIKLLQDNLSKNDEMLHLAREIKSHIRWQVAWSFIRLALIVVPLILGFIYLPPLVKDFLNTYSSFLPY